MLPFDVQAGDFSSGMMFKIKTIDNPEYVNIRIYNDDDPDNPIGLEMIISISFLESMVEQTKEHLNAT